MKSEIEKVKEEIEKTISDLSGAVEKNALSIEEAEKRLNEAKIQMDEAINISDRELYNKAKKDSETALLDLEFLKVQKERLLTKPFSDDKTSLRITRTIEKELFDIRQKAASDLSQHVKNIIKELEADCSQINSLTNVFMNWQTNIMKKQYIYKMIPSQEVGYIFLSQLLNNIKTVDNRLDNYGKEFIEGQSIWKG